MHTARNRRASRQHVSKNHQAPPVARSARQEQDFMLRSAGTPPAFPRELIVPGPQHALNAPPTAFQAESPAETEIQTPAPPAATANPSRANGHQIARRPKGKKARKAAMRMAAEQARKTGSSRAMAAAAVSPVLEPAPAPVLPPPIAEPTIREMEVAASSGEDILVLAQVVEYGPHASVSDAIPQHLPETGPEPLIPAEPLAEPAPMAEPAPIFLLPSAPEPLVTAPPPLSAALPPRSDALPSPAEALPLPRSRSLVPARRQGLVDVIAFLLRDSGRRLARWSARRHKMREQYAQVYASDLRKAAMQSQLEALEALRQQQQRR
jgi:hypothetical protein